MTEDRSRRQSRGKQPKSYRIEDAYSFLDDEEDGSGASGTQTPVDPGEELGKDDGGDFMPNEEEEEQDDEFMEDEIEDDDGDGEYGDVQEDMSRDDAIVEVGASDVDMDRSAGRSQSTKQKRKRRAGVISEMHGYGPGGQVKAPINFIRGSGTKMRSRGVADWGKGGQENRVKELFGPSHNDLMPVLKTRDKWRFQETLPSRAEGSLARSFYECEGAREKEIKATREWYEDKGEEYFVVGQASTELSEQQGKLYMANDGPSSIDVLLGGVGKQKVFTLSKGSYLDIAAPFDNSENRRGWLFNLGTRIQEAQWATKEEGSTQYLAVAVSQDPVTGRPRNLLDNTRAPAFTATDPFSASIQVWAFDASSNGDLDPSREPRLELVICTDWGAPKHFRWCPIGVKDSGESSGDSHMIHLGLLAGIWSDGKVRILNVSFQKPNSSSSRPQFLHFSKAAFEVAMPNTIPSHLHWLSGTSLAVASAAGTVAIWTLTRPGMFPPRGSPTSSTHSPSPWFYKQLADTYILNISSGYPSRPQYLSVTTADGFGRLYDLRSPDIDTTSSIRGRMLCVTQAWHEQTQSFIMPDEHYMLKNNALRRYYHNLYIMRAESTIVCCATSPVQPCVLLGAVDGTVVAGNPISRVMNSKEIPWQQPWFVHEWRPAVEKLKMTIRGEEERDQEEGEESVTADEQHHEDHSEGPTPTATTTITQESTIQTTHTHTPPPSNPKNNQVPQPLLSHPLARITEGYRAHQPGIQYPNSFKKMYDGAKLITIHEEQSAITTLAWNPNLRFGTWAVAGMADGLLRVEDVGV